MPLFHRTHVRVVEEMRCSLSATKILLFEERGGTPEVAFGMNVDTSHLLFWGRNIVFFFLLFNFPPEAVSLRSLFGFRISAIYQAPGVFLAFCGSAIPVFRFLVVGFEFDIMLLLVFCCHMAAVVLENSRLRTSFSMIKFIRVVGFLLMYFAD